MSSADLEDKRRKLSALARRRQKNVPTGFHGLGDFHGGAYECEFVSPYTKSAGNLDADVMFFLQDWSSEDRLSQPIDPEVVQLGYTPDLPTNRNLIALLKMHLDLCLSEAYVTNLFPFVKPGGLTGAIPARALSDAASQYAIPQIEIIKPRLVVCFGLSTFNAIRRCLGRRRCRKMAEAIEQPFRSSMGVMVWCQSHPGALGRANRNRGGVDRVTEDWRRMAGTTIVPDNTSLDV